MQHLKKPALQKNIYHNKNNHKKQAFKKAEVIVLVNNLTKGNPTRLILLFSLPMIIGNIFQQFYNLVDSAVVGRYVSVGALAAVGSTGSIVFLITGFAAGVATGFSVVISQRFGADDHDGVRSAYAATIVISTIMSVVLTVVSLYYMEDLLRLMKTPDDIFEDAAKYLEIIFLGMTTTIFYNVLSSVMRALGDSVTPLIFLIVCSILNIALDLLFVVVFGMGVEGVAYATILAQFISAILCFIKIGVSIKILRLHPKDFIPRFKIIWQILKIGLPMGFQTSIVAIGVMAIQATVNSLGTVVVAGYTAASKIEQLALQPSLSFGLTMATFTAQNLGAGRFDRIREGVKKCVAISMTVCVVLGGLLCIFGRKITTLFLADEAPEIINGVLDNAQLYLVICSLFVWALGLLYIYRNALQGLGNSFIPFFSGISELVLRVYVAIWLSGKIGFLGVCWSSPIAWCGAAALLMISFYIVIKRREKKAKPVTV